jgi:multidrug efflux pump subunit AcrA (membrane-fusion protein)
MTVWVSAGGGRFVKRAVRTGQTSGGFVEIEDGLKEGEQIAAGGSLFIANQYTNAGR